MAFKKCLIYATLLICVSLVGVNLWNFLLFFASPRRIDTLNSINHFKTEISVENRQIPIECDPDYLRYRIDDLVRLKASVLAELSTLEEKRNALRSEIEILSSKADDLQRSLQERVAELSRWQVSIEQAKLAYREEAENETPDLYLPHKPIVAYNFTASVKDLLTAGVKNFTLVADEPAFCTLDACFDHSRCSIASTNFKWAFVGFDDFNSPDKEYNLSCATLINYTTSLAFDPSNSILFIAGDQNSVPKKFNRTRAMIASHTYSINNYRSGYDFVIPPLVDNLISSDVNSLHPISPARRRYLLSFRTSWTISDAENSFLLDYLAKLSRDSRSSRTFRFDFNCSSDLLINCRDIEFDSILKLSTFSLIVQSRHGHVTSFDSQVRLIKALQHGAIPVIMGHFEYPLADLIDWRRCSPNLPKARIYELHYYIMSFVDSDILEFRRNCRLFYQTYFQNRSMIIRSVLTALKYRLRLPLEPVLTEKSSLYFNESYKPVYREITPQKPSLFGYVGPVESPYPSQSFKHNFSSTTLYAYDKWNLHADPFQMYQFNPFVHTMPSEAKFIGSKFGFRPINNGLGGSGKPFVESLGGNFPREQFTVILLTFEREQVLIEALKRLDRLPYLNKIIVVWNGPTPPSVDTIWPKITAPYVIVKMEQNSLNNRFLPFHEIETEAVLSLDDDVYLRQDEIVFGFRVWREARDRIVGFPGRFHGWDSTQRGWIYNSNHSCELSMVLTGAAFIHKYYLHVYSNVMDAAIRQKVDELMNCEDLAMNFLVAHITRKPPLKATSRWTFRCPDCTETLSADESHFNERHDCINNFTTFYGYNPLINTQFRVDSILFKTKVPPNHQQCFKYL